jgi:carbonic anhydrase
MNWRQSVLLNVTNPSFGEGHMSTPTNHVPTHFWKQQSPINLTKQHSIHARFPKSFLNVDYREAPFSGSFEGEEGHRNLVLDKPHSGKHLPTLTMGDVTAELVKIHLHTPSEHDLEGIDLGGEIHLIHRLASPVNGSELVVVGVFFNEDESAGKLDFFKMWVKHVEAHRVDKSATEKVKIDPRNLVPKNPNNEQWYRYEGSLTSEPYSEIVSWLVFVDPIGVRSADFGKLKDNAHQPERPVQPINRRFVVRNFS